MRDRKVEIWSPAEKAQRNFRMKHAWGRLFGFMALGVPAMVVSTACGIREAYLNENHIPDPEHWSDGTPKSELFRRSARVSLEQREIEENA